MKIAIIGSREWYPHKKLNTVFNMIDAMIGATYNYDKIISGGAEGVDSMVEQTAKKYDNKLTVIKPDMSKGYDVRKYHERNKQIVDEADIVISIWNKESKGTLSALKALVKVMEDELNV